MLYVDVFKMECQIIIKRYMIKDSVCQIRDAIAVTCHRTTIKNSTNIFSQ